MKVVEDLRFAVYHTTIGYIRIEHNENRLTLLQILQGEPISFGERDSFSDVVHSQIEEYLRGDRREFKVEIQMLGYTLFQRQVFKQMLKIPYAHTLSYKEIAEAISHPKAARAVGMAAHCNPIHIIIPCHRVISSSGALTGYAAGVDAKRRLLEIEQE